MSIVKWNARGTIIKVPYEIAIRSRIFSEFYNKNKESTFFINRDPLEVHKLINFLSNTKKTDIYEELMIDYNDTFLKLKSKLSDIKNWENIKHDETIIENDSDILKTTFEIKKEYVFNFQKSNNDDSIYEYQIINLLNSFKHNLIKVFPNYTIKFDEPLYIFDSKLNIISFNLKFELSYRRSIDNYFYSPAG